MYRLVKEAFEPGVSVDRGFLRKTAEIVQTHTRTPGVGELGPVYALDGRALERLAQADVPETVRVFNLIKAFYKLVAAGKDRDPYLIPIGERAETIAKLFQERQISSQEALRELEELVAELKEAEQAREDSELSPEGFAVFWYLRREGIAGAEKIAREVEEALGELPHWERDAAQERKLRRRMYKIMIDAGVDKVVELVDKLLQMLRRSG